MHISQNGLLPLKELEELAEGHTVDQRIWTRLNSLLHLHRGCSQGTNVSSQPKYKSPLNTSSCESVAPAPGLQTHSGTLQVLSQVIADLYRVLAMCQALF